MAVRVQSIGYSGHRLSSDALNSHSGLTLTAEAPGKPSPTTHASTLFLDAQKHALEMVVKGDSLPEVLAFLTSVVEQESEHTVVASILLLDADGRLRPGAGPSLPDTYVQAIDGMRADPAVGTCAAAAATGRVVITPDFDSDPGWAAIKHLPLGIGLVAAWSQPIVNRHGRVLGTFGTYFREAREPSAAERTVVEILSHTAALAIERARAEEAQHDSERRKDEFIATLSHELRNPLAPLRAALQLLRSGAHDADNVLRLQARMSRQVEQLVRLVDDLLEISHVTRGELRLQPQRVDMALVIETAVETCAPLVQSSRVELTVSVPEGPVLVLGDPMRLGQIVGNLLNNATKYTPAGGAIVVELRRGIEQVEVSIRDTGIGIDNQDLGRIFDTFVRIPHHTVEAQWGLGLGLPLARRLAEMHGGSIAARSEGLGRGSEFIVRLPSMA
jgi:signal transduction histidine kinase